MTTEFGPIRVAVSDYIATVTIDRPPVNAVDREALRGIRDAFTSLDDRRDVRVAIFTGAGSRAFMGGADLNTVGTRPQGDDVPLMYLTDPGRVARDAMWAVTDCAVPVIGAINGPAIGAGLAFAACCDILVAAEHAVVWDPRDQRGPSRCERSCFPSGRSAQGKGDVPSR